MSEAGLSEPVLKNCIIAQEHQAFAIEIEASERVDIWNGDELRERFAGRTSERGSCTAGELTENVERLVKQQVTKWHSLQKVQDSEWSLLEVWP